MNLDYNEFKARIHALKNWDPKSQLITKDLDVKSKPKNLNFCKRIFLWITHSRSKAALLATQKLQILVDQYRDDLMWDHDTLKSLKQANLNIQNHLVLKNKKIHIIRNRNSRNQLQGTCTSIQKKCHKLTPTKSPKGIYLPLKIKKSTQIAAFIRHFNPKTAEEATFYFNEISKHLKSDLTKEQANDILINTKKIKSQFTDDEALRNAHSNLRFKLRKKFFGKRLKQNKADLAAIKETYTAYKELHPTEKTVGRIIKNWQQSLDNRKPIDMPKWFHCTKKEYINDLILSDAIEVRRISAYKGAFVSTIPETMFGDYCILLGSGIEKEAKNLPVLTKADAKHAPIYVGATPPLKNQEHDVPRIWAGFQENISLGQPDKSNDPIGYYAHSNFLLAYIGDKKNGLQQISESNLNNLAERNIVVLDSNDFKTLTHLVSYTFHCHMPDEWIDSPFIRSWIFRTHNNVIKN